jgi:hypothetical protein
MKKLFNTEFEVSMRLLILIDSISSLNEDELTYLDFFSIYSKTFNFTNENLNGECSFPINEITLQRKLIRNALKELVLKSFVKVNYDNEKGYIYSATNEGLIYVSKVDDSYSLQYQRNVRIIQNSIYPIKIAKLKEIAAHRRDE